jgi:hypothetical protein
VWNSIQLPSILSILFIHVFTSGSTIDSQGKNMDAQDEQDQAVCQLV